MQQLFWFEVLKVLGEQSWRKICSLANRFHVMTCLWTWHSNGFQNFHHQCVPLTQTDGPCNNHFDLRSWRCCERSHDAKFGFWGTNFMSWPAWLFEFTLDFCQTIFINKQEEQPLVFNDSLAAFTQSRRGRRISPLLLHANDPNALMTSAFWWRESCFVTYGRLLNTLDNSQQAATTLKLSKKVSKWNECRIRFLVP